MRASRSVLIAGLLTVAGCGGAAAPAAVDVTVRAQSARPPEEEAPSPAPTRIEAVAADPLGRAVPFTVPESSLSACLRGAPRGSAGWVLLRIEPGPGLRPRRVVPLEREGLFEPIQSCVVAAIAGHDEGGALGIERLVYVAAW